MGKKLSKKPIHKLQFLHVNVANKLLHLFYSVNKKLQSDIRYIS